MRLQQYIISLRKFRVWHKVIGLSIALFLFISSITGILLALKKDFDVLQPPTQKGISKELNTWLTVEELFTIAGQALVETYPEQKGNEIDRMDVRPSKGVVKVLFKKGFWEVQLDGTSGEVKSIARRHSDWIEHLHDGSIISDWFKLLSMNYLGLGVLVMIITGLWLWYGPKAYRKKKQRGE